MAITVKPITMDETMDFFNREHEISRLRDIRERSREHAQFTIVTGRRRIGKTALVKRAYADEPLLYFFVARKAEADLCSTYMVEIAYKLQLPLPPGRIQSFAEVFRYAMDISLTRSFTLFIDEFQDFFRINASIFSEMQNIWDEYKDRSHINLVVAGSVNTLMHKIFMEEKEPLYGRQTSMMQVRPFRPSVLKGIMEKHCPGYDKADLLALFALTGGVPKYVEMFMDQKAFTKEDMLNIVLRPDSYFLNEGKSMLVEEFGKDYGTYFSILTLIAEGKNTRGDIECELGNRELSGYLQRLIDDFGIVQKRQPLFETSSNRNVRYAIDDEFLRFWFRFVYKYAHIIEADGHARLRQLVDRDFSTFTGFSLERYFTEAFKEEGTSTRLGYWHDRKGTNEIDLIAEDELSNTLQIIEIKRQKKNIDIPVLRAKADAFLKKAGIYKHYAIACKGLSIEDM